MRTHISRNRKCLAVAKVFRISLLILLCLLLPAAPVMAQEEKDVDLEVTCITKVPCADLDFNSYGCVTGGVEGAAVSVGANEEQNAKIVIGVAKTFNLGQQGALIGLMVGLAESGLKNYANTGVPLSMQNPAWLALPDPRPLGKDHDSVGIMQQRPSTGWSTIASGDAALSNKDAIWQLMNPVYAAQAFFGSPPGSNMPPALSKGLQNKAGWQSMTPWAAAQKVQASAFSDGRNYKAKQPQAQQLLGQYWDLAEPVPLAVPLNSGGAVGGGGPDPALAECAGADVNCSPDGQSVAANVRSKVVCIAKQELTLWQSGQLQPGTGYKKYSQGRSENWCADFASWVYNQAGYPLDNTRDGNVPTVEAIQTIGEKNQNLHWQSAIGGYIPKPGDLVIHQVGQSHINIVVAVNGNTITMIGGNQGKDGFNASLVTQYDAKAAYASDGINGYVSPD